MKRVSPFLSRGTVVVAHLLCLVGPVTHARGAELFGGWEGDTNIQGYAFVSLGVAGPLTPRISVAARITSSYLYYEFPEGSATVDVTSPGVDFLVGPRLAVGDGGSLLVVGGVELRRNTEEAADRVKGTVTKEEDNRTAARAQALLYLPFRQQNVGMLLVDYGDANQYIFSKLVLKRRVTALREGTTTSAMLGVDVTGQGNDDVRSFQVGGLIELSFVNVPLNIGLRAGYKRSRFADDTSWDGAYFGADFYTRFP